MVDGYSNAATERCERVLGTLMRGIGQPWRHKICLVGGLAPLYIVRGDGYGQPAHVGSTDVDVALRLALESEDQGAYATLETNLKRNGFGRVDGASWRWAADVERETVVLEFLGDVSDAAPGTVFRAKVTPPAGAGGVGLLCVRGVELVFRDALSVTRDVPLLDGARSRVEFQVANLTPFVALKADAYLDRRKAKDAYDLVYVLRWWQGGPAAAAAAFASSPVADEPFVVSAISRVLSDFASPDRAGAVDYASLRASAGSANEVAVARNEAVLVVRQFEEELRNQGFKAGDAAPT
ncbi:MAG: nucleotidyl transferase AbiEii/AbiGii toxin family protein [Coriobacteriia bacterium]|nr:nucleotidyl transferase AbiEii/AbiGii toxin family protein [Coriobacteriia bacterium]